MKLRVAKGQPAPSAAPQHSVNKSAPQASDWNDFSQSNATERPVAETADEAPAMEDEGEPLGFLQLLPLSSEDSASMSYLKYCSILL